MLFLSFWGDDCIESDCVRDFGNFECALLLDLRGCFSGGVEARKSWSSESSAQLRESGRLSGLLPVLELCRWPLQRLLPSVVYAFRRLLEREPLSRSASWTSR